MNIYIKQFFSRTLYFLQRTFVGSGNKKETEVIIVTLPETTPVYEAHRLQEDLQRAGIENKWWVINSSLYLTDTQSPFFKAKAQSEIQWINRVSEISKGNFAVIAWKQ